MSVATLRIAAGIAACLLTPAVDAAFAQAPLQGSPEGGGRCVDAASREFVQGQHLQMLDCNGSPSQLFAYDPASMRLTIGGFCVDADGGKPGDVVKLWRCDGNGNQVWKSEPKGSFTKLVGTSGLCFDIRFGSKESGALLQSWTCDDAAPNQLWSFQRK
jgi:hypothetical protein